MLNRTIGVAEGCTDAKKFQDVGYLDNARVILEIGNVRYIHANYVSTPLNSKRFICTQYKKERTELNARSFALAPLPKTCLHFWHMVVQERCSAILMLCNFTEKDANKCADYLPIHDGQPLTLEGDVLAVFRREEKFALPFSTRVQVQMTRLDIALPGQPVHTCTHYHWLEWFVDRGVPEVDLAPVALLDSLKECTFQTEHQYLYIHQVLLLHLKQAKYLDDSIAAHLEAFTMDYRKATQGEEETRSIQQKSVQQKLVTRYPLSLSSQIIVADRATVEEGTRPTSKAAKKAQVKVFVEETLRKGVKGLIAEFKSMKRVNDFTKMTEFVAQNPQGRNRYKDVGCLDNDRVIIRIGPISYIHANYVSSPTVQKRFICTQAPLPKTCPDFWYMVVQEKSVAILMLCNFVEQLTLQNANKCAEYFPLDEDRPSSFEGVTVVLKKKEQFPFPFETRVRIMVRTLEVSVPGQPLHTCLHYHWQDWPDRGVPDADLAPIVLLSKLKENTAPIIVHCSAGIGRTGSIVLIQHAMELLHLPAPLLEISSYLIGLRKQRNNSIQVC
ncbi:unnamed protein product [Angiostrongylus costaricensis]|uniref:Protein-tyrosine phosphatase n=1 Tax=Angiostrongylus costaricensis TaxID=334426 RepID=A0A158PFC8_ANGCS|nr:unnamed protein product [Angiostrongylus costaricensis]